MTATSGNKVSELESAFHQFVNEKQFACIAAKAALKRQQMHCLVAGHMACPRDDAAILQFLYTFINDFRASGEMYHSAAVLFTAPEVSDEKQFDDMLWTRLQALADLDAIHYGYDQRVAADPSSADFSFSLKQEAFFIIGLHPLSSRTTRRFGSPAMVFNPHIQFEQLRQTGKYETMKATVRKRDVAVSGSINPMLRDYGDSSEVYQYSGMEYDDQWQCPLKINHAKT